MTQNLTNDTITAKNLSDIDDYNQADCRFSHSPEDELLLCCARTQITPEINQRIKTLINPKIDWAYLIQTALQHRVLPLIYHSLNGVCPEAVPKQILTELQQRFYAIVLNNKLLTSELLKLLDLFAVNEIPAIPFKGPALATSVYGSLALRQFSDIDIIVHKEDMLKIQELLLSQGYVLQREGKEKCLTQANQNSYLQSQDRYDEWYWKTVNQDSLVGVRVEIHWETTPKHIRFPLNPEKLWHNLESISISDMTYPTLSPEDLLPILCINYSKDHWTQLKMICDIAELIRTDQELDWEKVIDHANSLQRERTLLVGLLLAHDFFGTALPKQIWQKMQTDPVAKSLAKQVSERLFPNCGSEPGWIEKTLFQLRLRENLEEKVRYIFFSTMKIFEGMNNQRQTCLTDNT